MLVAQTAVAVAVAVRNISEALYPHSLPQRILPVQVLLVLDMPINFSIRTITTIEDRVGPTTHSMLPSTIMHSTLLQQTLRPPQQQLLHCGR